MRLLLTIDGLPGFSAPVELPDDHEIVRHARNYADMRTTGDADEHLQAALEHDISARVCVEVKP